MGWQPQIFRIDKNRFHPVIVLKPGMAPRAFHRADFWFKDTGTEWTLPEMDFGFSILHVFPIEFVPRVSWSALPGDVFHVSNLRIRG